MKTRRSAKPVEVKVGNARVKIYTRTQKKASGNYHVFEVADFTSGKRRLISFSDQKLARAKATEIATKIANLEGAVLTLTNEDRQAYLRAQEFLKATGVPLELATSQFAEAHAKLAGRPLMEAINFYVARHPQSLPRIPVADAVQRFLQAKRKDGASDAYLGDLSKRLREFSEAFQCDLLSVTEPLITSWLRDNWDGRNRNNFRGAVRTLYRWATAEGFTTKETLDFDRIPKAKEGDLEIEIFTPEEMTKLLAAVQMDPEALPNGYNKRHATRSGLLALLILGGFAGMRTAEVQRQKWRDILLDRGVIRVTAAKGNTASKRLIPIVDNLRAWVAICGREGDVCCDYPRPWEALYRVADRAGLEWKHNALRHSYISYRVAESKSVAEVALDSGISPTMIFKHYRELVTEAEGKSWFAIMPADAKKILL